jgi:hypothetical protein
MIRTSDTCTITTNSDETVGQNARKRLLNRIKTASWYNVCGLQVPLGHQTADGLNQGQLLCHKDNGVVKRRKYSAMRGYRSYYVQNDVSLLCENHQFGSVHCSRLKIQTARSAKRA